MPCPYAELVGLLRKKVRCKLTGKIVDPNVYPCLRDYTKCEIFREHTKKESPKGEEREEIIMSNEHQSESSDEIEKMVNEAAKSVQRYYDPKKGERPPTCYDCLYYSPTTGWCLYLRRKIKNPEKPECYKK